ncbi:MAG: MBOAT family protein [Fibrobacterota bacterium]|nr:MAG: MBOAT family protein [Fibrobacterota bacterium]
MPFLSFPFLGSFALLLALYWSVPKRQWQNGVLLVGCLGFLSTWGWLSVALLLVSTAGEWLLAIWLERQTAKPKRLAILWTSIVLNVGTIALFKYACLLRLIQPILMPGRTDSPSLHLLAPIGVSFWVLQKMSLTFEVYYHRRPAERNPLRCLLFASYFPTLISGPVERARNLLPQFAAQRSIDARAVAEGFWLISIGIFQKVVVADNVAACADQLLGPDNRGGISVLIGIWAYAIQIFCDFAGYSDMVRGASRLLGIDILQNFSAPYLAQNLSEFWKRWHVSLSTWLNENIFNPSSMALRAWGTGSIVVATWLTFVASGLWHGTGWTFLIWGSIHALGLTIFVLTKDWRKRFKKDHKDSAWLAPAAIAITFHWVCLGYVFFRAPDVGYALQQLASLFHGPWNPLRLDVDWATLLGSIAVISVLHRMMDSRKDVFWIFQTPPAIRVAVYLAMLLMVSRYYASSERFLYFQF